ncbi:MAG: antibiotic biosynthesis monooxygenase [Candidatus Krumholzibacteria bacterium]|nr:antibiotic biosynthesis monooxygenase [Candidatus Krumholzibacteria bacterium]
MIARTWTGRTPHEKSEAYLDYVLRTGVEEQRRTPGNLGSWVLRRRLGDEAEFVVMSLWDSLESVKAFAGKDIDKARYYREDDDYLVDKPLHVVHHDVAHGPVKDG